MDPGTGGRAAGDGNWLVGGVTRARLAGPLVGFAAGPGVQPAEVATTTRAASPPTRQRRSLARDVVMFSPEDIGACGTAGFSLGAEPTLNR